MVTRRQLLLGAGAGAAGAALSSGALAAGAWAQDTRDGDAAAALAGQVRDASLAADTSGRPARLGTHRMIWSTTPAEPLAALTFDDGPTPAYTPRVLDALAEAGARATFYVIGANAVQHPALLREIVAAGHELANHSWSHLGQASLSAAAIRSEIVRCADAVGQLVQQPLVGFRPPRGQVTGATLRVCAELGYDVFLWSCTRTPPGAATPTAIAESVAATVQPGDIVDLHDGLGRGTLPGVTFPHTLAARREVEVRALPDLLRRLADRGITLTTASDLVARSAPEPLPGPASV